MIQNSALKLFFDRLLWQTCWHLFYEPEKTKAISIIGLYAYAFFRLLPSINKLVVNIQLIIFIKPSLNLIIACI